jgi:hypothetical protein
MGGVPLEINETAMRKCSFCGENIEIDLGRCPYCASLQNVKIDSVEEKFDHKTETILNNSPKQIGENLKREKREKPLGNGFKVLITMICTVIPCFGQLVGIIAGIIFMSSEDEIYGADKRSFGLALLIVNIIMFILSSAFWFLILLAFAVPFSQ